MDRPIQNQYSKTSDRWQLRTGQIDFGRLPVLMGIVNVTPDSFSDGGKFTDVNAAVDHALQLITDGAGIIDIGGESTRPYSAAISETEELKRTVKVVQGIHEQTSTPISIDTTKSKVASECIAAGAEIINDVTGLEGDGNMPAIAADTKAGVCAMHMQGTPQTMQDDPAYDNIVEDIFVYLKQRRQALLDIGIDRDRICLDPGIGFGKTHQHNLDLIAGMERFHDLDCPILVGHSRKGFIARVLGDKSADRAAASAGVAIELTRKGVQVIRVHDVKVVCDAIRLFDAVGGIDGRTSTLAE